MRNIYYLKNCNTSLRIIKKLPVEQFNLIDIKENPIKPDELDQIAKLIGSYESLFSRRAKLYKEMGLKDQKLSEQDYRRYILDEYTFLQRPVIIYDDQIFVGSGKKNVEKLYQFFKV